MVTTRLCSLTQEDGGHRGQQPASTAAASSQDSSLLVFKSGGLVRHGGGQFVLKGVTQDTMKFYQALGSLPETAVRGMGDLMHGPPPEDAYTQLKARLLAAHTLTEFQRISRQICCMTWCSSAQTARRRPGFSGTCFSSGYQRRSGSSWLRTGTPHWLPAPTSCRLTTHGSRMTPPSMRFWMRRDMRPQFWRPPSSHHSCGGRQGLGRGGQGRPFRSRGGGGAPPASMAPADGNSNAPAKLARLSSGLCRFHWQFGDKAYSCRRPCSWQGN